MLITKQGELARIDEASVLSVRAADTQYYINGFFYVVGHPSGEESVLALQKLVEQSGRIPFEALYGSFSCLMIDGQGRKLFFPCNSELHCIYYSDYAVSDRFLELVAYHQAHQLPLHYDVKSVCEYYTMGSIFFDKTLAQEIQVLKNDRYFVWQDGQLRICEKGIGGIDGTPCIRDAKAYWDDLAIALSNQKVAVSLTGGYDSRLVFTELYKKIPLLAFFAANVQTADGIAAERVAEAAGTELKLLRTEKPELTEELIRDMVLTSDGMQPLAIDSDYRILSFRRMLEKEHYTIQLTGDGGVLHKDWEWMQDLPFYHKKHTNLQRFYNHRIAYTCSPACLGERLQPCFDRQTPEIIRQMADFVKPTNTESYDAFYHYVSCNRKMRYNYVASNDFTLYAPLNELDLVRYSYHLPRRKRFYYNYMREMITDESKEIARIPTEYGMTASSEGWYLVRDAFIQVKEYGVKGMRMIRRRLKLAPKEKGVLDWTLEAEMRKLEIAPKAVAWAVQAQLLSADADASTLPYANLQRVLHLYELSTLYGLA